MLEELCERVREASFVVTFNGKSFDWPLLLTRLVLNRLPRPKDPLHLDLLHCARRVYKRRLKEVRLVRLERELLGMYRTGDIDGHEIPEVYWSYVRGAGTTAMDSVVEHNTNDVIALASLMGVLTTRYREVGTDDEPADYLGYAWVAMRAKDHERALSFSRAAAAAGGSLDVTVEACLLAARLLVARGEVHAARVQLEDGLVHGKADDEVVAALHLALAKLFEHRLKDFDRAREHADLSRGAESSDAFERRRARLDRTRARATASQELPPSTARA